MSNAPYSYDLHSARAMMQNNRDGWTIAAKELWELVRSDLACFDETKNPLFLWGALFNILVNAANPEENGEAVISKAVTIPPTIANYLMHVAFSLRLLSYGQPRKLPLTKDWVAQLNPALPKKVASKIALGAVPGVLGLGGKQGSSAFDQMYEYSRCIYDAIEYEGLIGKGISSQGALQEMLRQKMRNITTRRLQARIRVGRRLLKVAIPPAQKAP